MAIIKIRNVTSKVVLSHPQYGQILNVDIGEDVDRALSISLLDAIGDQIKAYVDNGNMTYTVEENPEIPDDIEAGAIDAAHYLGNSIRFGRIVSPSATPSDPDHYYVAVSPGEGYVAGVFHEESDNDLAWDYPTLPSVDLNGDPIVMPYLTVDGQNFYASIIFYNDGGVIRVSSIWGEIAQMAFATKPTAAQITAVIGHGEWLNIADIHVQRSGASISQTITNNRPVPDSFK